MVITNGTHTELNGSMQLCIDFRALSKVTQADPYHMPNIEEGLKCILVRPQQGILPNSPGQWERCCQQYGKTETDIGYYSLQLSTTKKKYAATEVECLAVVRAVVHFAIHLLGCQFVIITFHNALTTLHTSQKLNGRLMRWALALQDYTIVHCPGKAHWNVRLSISLAGLPSI